MKEKTSNLGKLIVIVILIVLAVKVTLWFFPLIVIFCLFWAIIYYLRRAGVIKPSESVSEAIQRFLNQ